MPSAPSLPPPPVFGLPDTFASWRDGQLDAILSAHDAPTRVSALVLPTGAGKSLVYMALAQMSQARALVLTSTKALQKQLTNDFDTLDQLAEMKGQSSYPCRAMQRGGELYESFGGERGDAWVGCDHGPCHVGVNCSLKESGCAYFDALARANRSRILVTNYAFWCTQYWLGAKRTLTWTPDLLILDEAHEAPNELAASIGASIAKDDVSDILHEPLGRAADRDAHTWIAWAKTRAHDLRQRIEDDVLVTSRERVVHVRRAQWLLRRLERVAGMDPQITLTSDEPDGVKFDVVWAAAYAEKVLLRGVPKIVLTSATLTKKTADLLGIPSASITWHESAHSYPIERRSVYVLPTIRVDSKMTLYHENVLLNKVDQIVAPRADRKGLIHTVSYKRRDLVITKSDHARRMITHSRRDTQGQIAAFKASRPESGRILVSPSMTTGYDFPYTAAEFQIIVKVPFPDSRDPIISARTMIDPDYPLYVAMQQLVQMVGRIMRAPDDAGETFILDDHARWFLPKCKKLGFAPRWFWAAVQWIDKLPPVPPALDTRRVASPDHDGDLVPGE